MADERLREVLFDETNRICGSLRAIFIEAACHQRGFGDDLSRIADDLATEAYPVIHKALAAALDNNQPGGTD